MTARKDELVAPAGAIYERLGLKPRVLVESTKAINIRKIRHIHPDTGVESLYFNASDVIALLDREYEVTEDRSLAQLSRVLRQMSGKL